MPEGREHDPNATNAGKESEWTILSLEEDQLSAARQKHYPRRQLKPSEALLFWALRIYVLFMLGVVFYQVWTTAH
jgi:hypothetical protein